LLPIDALSLVEGVGAALSAAHTAGVVHRDLKPENIMVIPDNGWMSVKLLDFGIAKLLEPEDSRAGLTSAGVCLGTTHYMAPEQILCDDIDARTDVYALGVLLYWMVTGRVPFYGRDRLSVQMMHLDHPVPRASDRAPAAAPWDSVIWHCMAKAPSERPASVAEVLASLRVALDYRQSQESGDDVAIQFEIGGAATTDEDWYARATAMQRAVGIARASGWSIVLEVDNALVARASGAVERAAEVVDAALQVLPSALPHGLVARVWVGSQLPPLALDSEVPTGVYVTRKLDVDLTAYTNTMPPGLSEFVRVHPR
jgi:serine/threonine-protein kinase